MRQTLALFLLMTCSATKAAVIYDFVGDCEYICTGQSTGTITLAGGYSPGDAFTLAQFVSMYYVSDKIEYFFEASDIEEIFSSQMPVSSGAGNVNLNWWLNQTGFISNESEWRSSCGQPSVCIVSNPPILDPNDPRTEGGSIGTWTLRPVPIPAAAWLFGSALGLLGWARRRTA